MEVYQRRENLSGLKKKLVQGKQNFLETKLGVEEAEQIEFQRVQRVSKRVSTNGKPRQIIASFWKYPQREEVMFNARKLKGKNFGISRDLPSEILERRKKKVQQLKQATKDGKTAYFSMAELA